MLLGLLADIVVLIHLAFVAFAVAGGFLVLRWPRIAWMHLPAAIWGAAIEIGGWICPLTPLEIKLRRAAGERAYSGDFVDRYLLPLLYPPGLDRELQLLLAAGVIAVNLIAYGLVLRALYLRRTRRS